MTGNPGGTFARPVEPAGLTDGDSVKDRHPSPGSDSGRVVSIESLFR
jgi:hypothetical protein